MVRRSLIPVLLGLLVALGATPVSGAPNDPRFAEQWGMIKVGAETAWSRSKGAGVKIAIVDSGVDVQHEDLSGKISNDGYDFIQNDNDPRDENGHGTHVAGIAAATTFNSKGVAGVAPDAQIMSVRVLGGAGVNVKEPDPSSLDEIYANTAEGVRWAAEHGAKVINLSLGGVACDPTQPAKACGPSASLAREIENAWLKGALCVVAAGNDSQPGMAPMTTGYTTQRALVVVATTSSDQRAGYSNTAGQARWAISAPGSSVLSTWYTHPIGDHREYELSSGTSMAAPHVSGAAALLFAMGLSNQQVVDRLLQTAKDIGPAGNDSTFGHGRLDVAAATNISSSGGGGSGTGSGSGSGGGNKRGGGTQSSPTPASPGAPPSTGASPQPGPTITSIAGATNDDGRDDGSTGGPSSSLMALTAAAIAMLTGGSFYWLKRRTAGGSTD